jgi:hypothetical protein
MSEFSLLKSQSGQVEWNGGSSLSFVGEAPVELSDVGKAHLF